MTVELVSKYLSYETSRDPPSVYTSPNTLDAWRIRYPRQMIAGFLRAQPELRWLTVGDGYYGSDAHFLLNQGVSATASCLSASVLSAASERGWIKDWRVENAESISLGDNSVDFVLCMETLQHCELPEKALDETLRVARFGLALMGCIRRQARPLDRLRESLRTRLRGSASDSVERYAPTGGKLTRLDRADIVRLVHQRAFHSLAVKEFNMLPLGKYWDQPATPRGFSYWLCRAGFAASDLLCWLRLMTPSFSWFLIFKSAPSKAQTDALRAQGFEFEPLRS